MDSLFQFHKLNQSGQEKAQLIAEYFDLLLKGLKSQCPENTREFSVVKTKLEEACFFAKKSMAIQKENQSEET